MLKESDMHSEGMLEVNICIDCKQEFSFVQEYNHFTGTKLPAPDRCVDCDNTFLMYHVRSIGPCVYIMKRRSGYYVGSCLSLEKRYSLRELDSLFKTFPCAAWQRRQLEQGVIEYLTMLHVPLMNKRRAYRAFHSFLRGHTWYHLPEDMLQFCKMLAHNTKQQGEYSRDV